MFYQRLILIVVLIFGSIALKDAAALEGKTKEQIRVISLHECKDDTFKVKFLCHPDWEIRTEEDTLLIIISDEPYVTMTIAKSKTPIVMLDQLSDPLLKFMGGYADGFTRTNVKVGPQDAVEVRGVSEKNSKTLLLDYYVPRGEFLYSVLFSVDPQESWSGFEALIYKIRDSFTFVN